MAEKKAFFCGKEKEFFREEIIEYTYYAGFAISQKQKSINSFHNSIRKIHTGCKILEISTKSEQKIGIQLSAFNLKFYHKELEKFIGIENVFQSSKLFEKGGPYRDLLYVQPKEAKRDTRLKTSGEIKAFNLYDEDWPLKPETIFYDWIYISALKDNMELAMELLKFDCFTDIEFNHKKSINCQARAAAIFTSLYKKELLEEKMASKEAFKSVYYDSEEQLQLF